MKKSYIYALITVLIWATMAAAVKSLLNGIPNFQTLSVSSAFAFLFLLLVNIANGTIKEMKHYRAKDYLTMAGLGFLGLFMYSSLYYYGLSQLSSQEACILNYLWPMMLVFFASIILKEKLNLKKIIAMILSFLGIVVLTLGNAGFSSGNRLPGVFSCIAAAACYGLFSVLNKKHNMNQNITMMVIWFTTSVCSFIAGMIFEEWVLIQGVQWLGILWLGVAIDAVAYLLWAIALKGAKNSAAVANLAYLTPFLSIVISAVFLKEEIHISAVIALVLIVGGIALQSISESKIKENKR